MRHTIAWLTPRLMNAWKDNEEDESADWWKDDTWKARRAIEIAEEFMDHCVRTLPRAMLLDFRRWADSDFRKKIDEELKLRGPTGEPRAFNRFGGSDPDES